jgi:hypothetical protein
MPVFSTKMMPASAARSGTRGRPVRPCLIGGRGGTSRSTSFHSSSLTNRSAQECVAIEVKDHQHRRVHSRTDTPGLTKRRLYYAAKTRPPSARSISDAVTTTLIEKVHGDNFGVYGARKVHAELHRQGHPVARCTVTRLMRGAGLRGITRAKGPRMTVPGARPDTRPDLVDRRFTAPAANAVWLTDIERHEALLNRAVVKGHRGRSVAAGR